MPDPLTSEEVAAIYARPPAESAAECCAIEHPTQWTASTGEQFTITQPIVRDGAIYLIVNVLRDGAAIHSDDHYIHGLSDIVEDPVVDVVEDPVGPYRDWVVALRHLIERITL